MYKKHYIKCKKSNKTIDFSAEMNIIKLTEPNTPLNDADHVGSFKYEKIWYSRNRLEGTNQMLQVFGEESLNEL